jgi:hypothetical protein
MFASYRGRFVCCILRLLSRDYKETAAPASYNKPGCPLTRPQGAIMKTQDAIKYALSSTQNVLNMYLEDLSDADLLVRPAPGANHIAWQLGHLIASESRMGGGNITNAVYPELPAGFAERHNKDTASRDAGFGTKAEYLALFNKVRQATIDSIAKLSDADLDKPTSGPVAAMAPTVGAMLLLNANHAMMHAGQFSVVRRKLGKPVLF